ncbi:hypothetical protein [Peribacillus sp. TH16]|uniref:hypothetical protein n=1 Tax=Peribacillus sp. TH16 TaxID=2798482 RepID=UPI001A930CC5|nr:hypothetical protein [Peribacillus sp. TH16]
MIFHQMKKDHFSVLSFVTIFKILHHHKPFYLCLTITQKYTAKYNIVKNKIKIRSDCLCIVNHFHPMNNVWIGANPMEDMVMNVPIYVSSMQGQALLVQYLLNANTRTYGTLWLKP